LPLDLAPANPAVLRCDFLHVDIGCETVVEGGQLLSLAREAFNAVVFCLVLEYLPSPGQRLVCLERGAALLREGGLLCIVTPDSSHPGKNCQQLKAWRRGLAALGLSKGHMENILDQQDCDLCPQVLCFASVIDMLWMIPR